jgi:hypothetical protein
VLEHPARATRWVRAATILILPKEEDSQIYSIRGGCVIKHRAAGFLGEVWKGRAFHFTPFPHDSCSVWHLSSGPYYLTLFAKSCSGEEQYPPVHLRKVQQNIQH